MLVLFFEEKLTLGFQIYKRTCMKRPLPPQGHRAGDPVSTTHEVADAHRGTSPHAEAPAAPAPVHSDTIR